MSLSVAMVGLRAPGVEGGIEQVVAELGPRLVDRGHRVTVFCRQRWNPHGASWRGMELVDVPTVYTKHAETLVYTALAMPAAVRRRFDVIHVHAVGPALLAFLPRAAGRATVVTVHGLDWRRDKWGPIARFALRAGAWTAGRSSHALITVSEETTAWFRRAGFSPRHIPNGVTPLPFRPLHAADVPDLQPGYLLYLGRLVPEKAIETVLVAHRASGTPRQLVIAGSPSHTPAYARKLRRLASPGALFVGYRSGDSKLALIHNAAAMVFPSRMEGLPLSMLEAMAAGRPILASDIPPHRQLLGEHAGTLLPVDSLPAWTEALAGFDAIAHLDRGCTAARRAQRRFGWGPIVDRTIEVYREAIATAGS